MNLEGKPQNPKTERSEEEMDKFDKAQYAVLNEALDSLNRGFQDVLKANEDKFRNNPDLKPEDLIAVAKEEILKLKLIKE
jgi:hypothetical protein